MERVLFLCSGNYYRSRFAEIVFNWHAERKGSQWRADSRGLAVDSRNPGPISSHAMAFLQDRGILSCTSERYPLPVADQDFATARHVVAIKEHEHRPLIDAHFSRWSNLVEYWHVHDLDCATPDVAIPQLEAHVMELLDRLAGPAASESAAYEATVEAE